MGNKIDLWLVDPETVNERTLLQASRGLLSDCELARGNRFHSALHRRDYLITRWLARTVLSEKLALPAHSLQFGANAYGRPHVVTHPKMSFNISHTSGLIALAIAREGEFGVDVERLSTGRVTPQLAEYCFAASERAALRATSTIGFDEEFFRYWTLKESYVKALGTGLSIGLDTFSFDLRNVGSIEFTPPVGSADVSIPRFCLLRPFSGYLCAICVRLCPQPFSLNAWNVVPLISKTAFDVTLLRHSTT